MMLESAGQFHPEMEGKYRRMLCSYLTSFPFQLLENGQPEKDLPDWTVGEHPIFIVPKLDLCSRITHFSE